MSSRRRPMRGKSEIRADGHDRVLPSLSDKPEGEEERRGSRDRATPSRRNEELAVRPRSPPLGGSSRSSSAGLRTRGRSGLSAGAYWPSLPDPNLGSVHHDGGRSRSPLRGSPGFTPGSLFTPRVEGHRRRLHHIGGGWLVKARPATSDCRPRLVSPDESESRARGAGRRQFNHGGVLILDELPHPAATAPRTCCSIPWS